MTEPSAIWIDWIIQQHGIVPIWTEDDIHAIVKKAVDLATDHARAELLRAHGRILLEILTDPKTKGMIALSAKMRDLGMAFLRDSNELFRDLAHKAGRPPE